MQAMNILALAGICRYVQGRKAALDKMFTVTWLGGVCPLHLDLLEPNKWKVYLCTLHECNLQAG